MIPPDGNTYWSEPAATLLGRLQSGPQGLSTADTTQRLEHYGRNVLREERSLTLARVVASQFRSPLVLILVFAAIVSLVVQDWLDATIILAIVLGSAALGAAQEYRASAAVRRLRARIAFRTRVLRDGVISDLPADQLVPGDIVMLSAGSQVPGDGIVLEAKDFFVNQALLTGESLPVEKQAGTVPPASTLTERHNTVFMGTSVRSGTARVLIVKTGRATEIGSIAKHLQRPLPETEFERGLRQFGYLLTRVAAAMVVAVFAVHMAFARPLLESLLFAIALAVGISPELLPAILTVTLARGARRMATRGVIVRRLNAIENLGSMDVLCTDKTGTLTEGVVRVKLACDASGHSSPAVLRDAGINARFQTGLTNPLDEAIQAATHDIDLSGLRKLDEIPYDFMRKRLSVVVEDPAAGNRARLISKGAVLAVLEACTAVMEDGQCLPLDEALRTRLDARFREWSAQGFRVLAVASRELPLRAAYHRDDERELVLSGFLLCSDPPDPQSQQTLADLAKLGVDLKIITGDNRYIAAHVADAVGLNGGALLTGAQLDAMHDEALWAAAADAVVFAEVDPNQKERIIHALRKTGHVVGYLGDGINDAPALQAADVGISVDRAVDVAKEAADIVLLEHDLAVLQVGIQEGRKTFANTVKYIFATTSANFGNMLSMAAAALFLPFLPLLAKQILLNNFLSDVPSVFIAGDRVDPSWLYKPYRWSIGSIRQFMVRFGLISTFFDFITFGVLWWLTAGNETLFRTGWFVESLLSELVVLLVIRTTLPFYRSRPAPLLLWSTVVVIGLTLILPYLSVGGIFNLAPMPGSVLVSVIGITLAYVMTTEYLKLRFYRRMNADATGYTT